MVGRVFAAAIVTFWLASMAALVRFEYFPAPPALEPVSTEQVLGKVFSNAVPARMTVFYQGRNIGRFTMTVNPGALSTPDATSTPVYHVDTKLHLRLLLFGMPTRLTLDGSSTFDSHYEVMNFALNSLIGDGRAEVRGDRSTDKVKVVMTIGDTREAREFPFSQVGDGSLAAALGVPGVADLSSFGAPDTRGAPARRVVPVAHYDMLHVGEGVLRTYLVEYKLDEQLWGRIWVSEDGALLQIETSFGLRMLDNQLTVASDAGVKPRS